LAKQAYSRVVADGIAPDTLIAKARQYAEAKADVDAKWLKMPANWLKEECWLEDPQPPRPREPKPYRAAMTKPHSAKGKMQEPAGAAKRVVNKQRPVVKSAKPVVEKPARAKPLANGQTDKARASPKAYGELSPPAPKLATAEPPKPALKRATSGPFTTGAIADGSKLPRPAIRADAPESIPPAVALSITATKPTEPPMPHPMIGREAPAKAAARSRRPLSFADAAAMLRVFVETPRSFDVERVLQDYFSVEQSSDIPAEPLAELLTRIGLDEKGIAAIRTELLDRELSRKRIARAAPPPVKAPDPVIASALGKVNRPFTPGAIAAEAPKLSVKDTLLQCAEGRMTIPVDMAFAMRDLFGLKQKEDMLSERLAKTLASAGLDVKDAAAIKKQLWSLLELFS
jgi:hypothetical protein